MTEITVRNSAPFIERDYRHGGKFQWVRETVVNAIEANATYIEYGVEWQGITKNNVYRRAIIDNGDGMTPDELRSFSAIMVVVANR
jgi:hypothetical protein